MAMDSPPQGVLAWKGAGAEDSRGVRLVWQYKIIFVLLSQHMRRAILFLYIFMDINVVIG